MAINPVQTIAQNKLLLLYLLCNCGVELSELQVMRIMSELDCMQYFDLKESLFELEQNNQIYSHPSSRSPLYGVTPSGKQMIEVLKKDLRLSLRNEIDEYLKTHREELKKESQLVGRYIKLGESEYRVTLNILEQDLAVFELNITVYSREQAQEMVNKWKDNAISLYKDITARLS